MNLVGPVIAVRPYTTPTTTGRSTSTPTRPSCAPVCKEAGWPAPTPAGRRGRRGAGAGDVRRVDAELGPLAGLVNNAGVVDMPARVDEMSVARLQRMFAVNMTRQRALRARGGAAHEHAPRRPRRRHRQPQSSAAARLGSPAQYVDYAASKGAIDTFTLGLAREVAAEGIRVNAVRPGHHRHRHPCQRRPARPRQGPGAAGADAARRQRRRGGRGGDLAAVGRPATPPAR
jgi:NAD(P)-dependent dehydrogenase (short-subunit alcohol dehydrogenase family)